MLNMDRSDLSAEGLAKEEGAADRSKGRSRAIHLEVLRSTTIGRDLSQSPTLLQSCTRIKIEYPAMDIAACTSTPNIGPSLQHRSAFLARYILDLGASPIHRAFGAGPLGAFPLGLSAQAIFLSALRASVTHRSNRSHATYRTYDNPQ
jgi:hypothetical protein